MCFLTGSCVHTASPRAEQSSRSMSEVWSMGQSMLGNKTMKQTSAE